ncbi:phage GP46 family protein [Acetobacter cibinongensis]|uniref:phage GP46 family protein n=1 Tax=Acetobacter cibinongensis TaxID=146475 RepID=UPI000A384728|nr:phage GP46 family protein [Acetobacter cibinongensis]
MDTPTTLYMRSNANGRLDLVVQPGVGGRGTLAVDTTLATSASLALQCDRRAETDDTLPNDIDLLPAQSGGLLARRGWVGDVLNDVRAGSRLWLLARGKCDETDRLLGAHYADESLDAVAQYWGVTVSVGAALSGRNTLNITAQIGVVSVSRSVSASA